MDGFDRAKIALKFLIKKFFQIKKISCTCPKKTNFFKWKNPFRLSSRKTNFFKWKNLLYYPEENWFFQVKKYLQQNINPQPLEAVIYIMQVIKMIVKHAILIKKLCMTWLLWSVFPHFKIIFAILNQQLLSCSGRFLYRSRPYWQFFLVLLWKDVNTFHKPFFVVFFFGDI